jgi:molybdopterin biosynthesis enzyme
MGSTHTSSQRIVRLAPLPEVLASIGRFAAVAPREISIAEARGRVLADDAFAPSPLPAATTAARDGWAVAADQVADASTYAPMPVNAAWVDAGDPMPPAADAILPPEAVVPEGGSQHALAAAPIGEEVLVPGSDADARAPLRTRGMRLRASDVAALRACGVEHVQVHEPRIAVIASPSPRSRREAVTALIADMIASAGGVAAVTFCGSESDALACALRDARADAIVTIGGTGAGRNDATVRSVATHGSVAHHGIGIMPGETAAFGACGDMPVLMLPGRLDAALAAWLLVGLRLLRQLTGATEPEPATHDKLARKIVSTIGVAEMILVRRDEDGVVPTAAGLFPLQALARADGYVIVPPESEGFPAGANVTVRALP